MVLSGFNYDRKQKKTLTFALSSNLSGVFVRSCHQCVLTEKGFDLSEPKLVQKFSFIGPLQTLNSRKKSNFSFLRSHMVLATCGLSNVITVAIEVRFQEHLKI